MLDNNGINRLTFICRFKFSVDLNSLAYITADLIFNLLMQRSFHAECFEYDETNYPFGAKFHDACPF